MNNTPGRLLKRTLRRTADATLARPLGSIVRIGAGATQVVLTFDDGPHPEVTPQLLDVLAEHEATATFFVLLTRVRRRPGLLAAITAAGHEVALHGPDHRRLTGRSPREVLATLRGARDELADALGTPVRHFRPPYGAQSPLTLLIARRLGLTTVLWDASIWDWKDVPDEQRLARMRSQARPGSIVLAHDGRADADDGAGDEPAPVLDKPALLRRVLTDFDARGLRVVSLEKALAGGAVPLRSVSFSR